MHQGLTKKIHYFIGCLLLGGLSTTLSAHNKVVVIPIAGEDTTTVIQVPAGYPALVEKTGQTVTRGLWDDGEYEKGVSWPSPRFTDHGNGTVTDELTGLMWLKDTNCPGATRDWVEALVDANQLNITGTMNGQNCLDAPGGIIPYNGWRLPNIKELLSLIDYSELL